MQNSELLKKYNFTIIASNSETIQTTYYTFSSPSPLMQELPLQTTQHKIKTFAYQSLKSFHKSYTSFLANYRNKEDMRDMIKIWSLFLLFLLFGGLFMYYINLASTRGYFMRLETQKLESNKAKNDIMKLEVIREKKENRDNLYTPKVLNLQKNLVTIEISELTGWISDLNQ